MGRWAPRRSACLATAWAVERNSGFAGESGDRPAAVADERIARRNDAGERGSNGCAVDLRQDRVEGRPLPVAGDEDGDVVLMEPRMSGRSAPFARLARQIGPSTLERFEDEGFVRFDDPSQRPGLVACGGARRNRCRQRKAVVG
jgi:hypothetical protein